MPSIQPVIPKEPPEVTDLYRGVRRLLDLKSSNGKKAGNCKYGVYLFRDYDGEPIYVGQTAEGLRIRIGRHLTNQRTDAVAMSVLDPFEVDDIEMWPLWDLSKEVVDKTVSTTEAKATLNRMEFTVYSLAIRGSAFGVILNENQIAETEEIQLPKSVRGRILLDDIRSERQHPDLRLARRARTIANLARVISEREVKVGIRRTLLAQAQRLENLARTRLQALDDQPGSVGPTGDSLDPSENSRLVLRQFADALKASAQSVAEVGQDVVASDLMEMTLRVQAHRDEVATLLYELLESGAGSGD